ncbi:MAG: 3-phosphoshikimate 1-carboxyvinyltransferase [Oscillospiraceae bacterium]|nr:3-phosphoshikimate 1-carboxyvinyltransferase [Oscillospiraceae bacterium]
MRVSVAPGAIKGEVWAIPSKSHLHRLLICAALADRPTLLRSGPTAAEDITATIDCLSALGAKIERVPHGFAVTPTDRARLPAQATLPCGESGSTLRFMLPVVPALGVTGRFELHGRLPQRPLAPLDAQLIDGGVRLSWETPNVLRCEGQLRPAHYTLPGDISSQYITGLLLALPLLNGESSLTVTGQIESEDYITMTLQAMAGFGLTPPLVDGRYQIGGTDFKSPGEMAAEGDWSNAAFWLCAGAMPGGDITCRGLSAASSQGDRAILPILEAMGARANWEGNTLRVREGRRRAVEIDGRATPDLIPVLCAVAALADGETVVKNAARLRLKESDRLTATAQTLNALGAKITEEESSLRIQGVERLKGGAADSWGDHRIAMMAAVASAGCEGPVAITGGQAVRKSYPGFWDELSALGKQVSIDE